MKKITQFLFVVSVALYACNENAGNQPGTPVVTKEDAVKPTGREVNVGGKTYYIKDSATFKGKGGNDEDYECFFAITADSVFTTILNTDTAGKVANYETNSIPINKLDAERINCQKGSDNDFTLNLYIKDDGNFINYTGYNTNGTVNAVKISNTHVTFSTVEKIKEVAKLLGVKDLPIADK